MSVIEFPGHNRRWDGALLKRIESFADLVPTDAALESRADELLPEAERCLAIFRDQPDAIAEMLAYAAARLERVGFKMFRG